MSATRHQSDGHEEIVALDALPLSAAIRRCELSCREVMQAYLAQIERFDPRVNAIVSLQAESRLLTQADEHDRQLARGEWLGWMHSMPQMIKGLAATSGIPTTLGSLLFAEQVPKHDAIVIERVKSSGAITIGKISVPEFGLGSQTYNPLFGTTRNAYDPARIASGSSGGAAVALALHTLPVADGSDMMGSLCNPATYNNVYDSRPSQGRVPHGPQAELFVQQLATEGPMGRSVADLARLLATQAGYDLRCPLSLRDDPRRFVDGLGRDFRGARLGWLGDYAGYLPMEEGVLEPCETALGDPAELGCDVEVYLPDYPLECLWRTWLVHRQWLMQGSLGELYADPARRVRLKPEMQWEVESGLGLSAAEVYRASLDRSDWHRAPARLFERYDFPLLSSARVFPFDAETARPRRAAGRSMDIYHRQMEVVIDPTLAGLPAISVPIGFGTADLPMGLQIIGPAQADLAVLQLAHAHEGLIRWVSRRPPAVLETPGGTDQAAEQCYRICRFPLHDLGLHLALP